MTEKIETLISKIESESPDLEVQAKLVIKEAKDLRKKVIEGIGGGAFAEETINKLEQDIVNFPQVPDGYKRVQAEKCRNMLAPILGKNIDIINDIYEAFAKIFIKYLDKTKYEGLDSILDDEKYDLKRPISSLVKGTAFYHTLSDILIKNKRFTRYSLSNSHKKESNADFNSLKKKENGLSHDFKFVIRFTSDLRKYFSLLKDENASYNNYEFSILNIDLIKRSMENIYTNTRHKEIIRKLAYKLFFRCCIYNLVSYNHLISKVESGEIKLPQHVKKTKDKILNKLRNDSLTTYKDYLFRTDYLDEDIKKTLDKLPQNICDYYKKMM